MFCRIPLALLVLVILETPSLAYVETLTYKDQLLTQLVRQVPGLLKTFDAETGRFGTGTWICRDQQRMYPLAVAYATAGKNNTYYHDDKLLDVIIKAGDALIDDADPAGQWVFRKKDGSM